MANKKNNNYENVVKPIVVLVVICLITSTLLAVTNYFTAPIIKAQEQQAAYAAYFEVLPGADNFTSVEGFATTGVEEAVKADNGTGYAFKAIGKGFGGDVPVIVGVDMNGVITGVSFMQNSETSGFGARLWDGSADGATFAAELTGKSGSVALGSDGVNGLSGATVSSTAVVNAVNSALSCFAEVALGQEAAVEVAAPATLDEAVTALLGEGAAEASAEGAVAAYTSADGALTLVAVEAEGFAPMTVAVSFDAEGVVAGLWVDVSGQTQGIGTPVGEAAYTDQFVGLSDAAAVDGVDALAGATLSSNGVKTGVAACMEIFQTMKGGN